MIDSRVNACDIAINQFMHDNKFMAKIGRPTKYDPKYCKELIEFFDRETTEIRTVTKITKDGPVEIDEIVAAKLPTFERFAVNIGVHVETLLNWGKEHPAFFEAYKKAKALQKETLIQNGLAGLYQTAAFIFVAKNCTDMRDRQEVDHSGNLTLEKLVGESFKKDE